MEITPVEELGMAIAGLRPIFACHAESTGAKIIEEYTPAPGASIHMRYVKGLRLCSLAMNENRGLWWLGKPCCGLRIATYEKRPRDQEVGDEPWRVSFDAEEPTLNTILLLGGEVRTILQTLELYAQVCSGRLSKSLEGCRSIIVACEVLKGQRQTRPSLI